MAIMLEFEKPQKHDYHCAQYEGDSYKCPPIKRGDDCYGDCIDCCARELDLYEKRKKVIESSPNAKR